MESEVFLTCKHYLADSERHTERSLKSLFSDGAEKYLSEEFESFLNSRDMLHLTTNAYTP